MPDISAHLLPNHAAFARCVRHKQKANMDKDQALFKVIQDDSKFSRVEDDLLIFAAQVNLEFLAYNPHWFADGTFRVTPQAFRQLYTLHEFLNGVVLLACTGVRCVFFLVSKLVTVFTAKRSLIIAVV